MWTWRIQWVLYCMRIPCLSHGGIENLVKLQKRLARKRYLKSKRVYEYERISLNVPKEFHEAIKPYLEEDMDLRISAEKGSLTIVLTPVKTLRHAASNPTKTQEKSSQSI